MGRGQCLDAVIVYPRVRGKNNAVFLKDFCFLAVDFYDVIVVERTVGKGHFLQLEGHICPCLSRYLHALQISGNDFLLFGIVSVQGGDGSCLQDVDAAAGNCPFNVHGAAVVLFYTQGFRTQHCDFFVI